VNAAAVVQHVAVRYPSMLGPSHNMVSIGWAVPHAEMQLQAPCKLLLHLRRCHGCMPMGWFQYLAGCSQCCISGAVPRSLCAPPIERKITMHSNVDSPRAQAIRVALARTGLRKQLPSRSCTVETCATSVGASIIQRMICLMYTVHLHWRWGIYASQPQNNVWL
jgi:hypothetical protein